MQVHSQEMGHLKKKLEYFQNTGNNKAKPEEKSFKTQSNQAKYKSRDFEQLECSLSVNDVPQTNVQVNPPICF